MDYEKFLDEIKYNIQILFGYDIDVLHVRFYEDDRCFEFYIKEFAEGLEDIFEPEWEDSKFQIREESRNKRFSLLINGKVANTYVEGTEDNVCNLLEDLVIFRESGLPTNEIFSGKKNPLNPYSIDVGDFQDIAGKKDFKTVGFNHKYNLSNGAIEAIAEGEWPYTEIDEEWLIGIGWKGSVEEAFRLMDEEIVERSSRHHMRLKKGDPHGTFVNFYDKYSFQDYTDIYEIELSKVSNIQEAVDFGIRWFKWKVSDSLQGGELIKVNETVRFSIDLEWGETALYDMRYFSKGKKPRTILRYAPEEETTNWVLDLIEKIERN